MYVKPLYILIMLMLTSCVGDIEKKLGLSEDNLGEEIIEDVIKGRTGVDMDLTPGSEEK